MKDMHGDKLEVGDYASLLGVYGKSVKGGTIVQIISDPGLLSKARVRVLNTETTFYWRPFDMIKKELEELI